MSLEFVPQIDAARCIGCELCVKLCPHHVLMMLHNAAFVARPDSCEYTGACQEICPAKAISLIFEIVVPSA